MGHPLRLEGRVEVEDVAYLECGPVVHDEIPADHYMHVIGRRRRQHRFQFARAGLHLLLEARGKRTVHYELALKARRKSVTFSQSGREMLVVCPIPVVDLAVMILVVAVTVTTFVTIFVTVAMTMIVIAVVGAIIIAAVVLVVSVAVSLRRDNCRGKPKCDHCGSAGAEPKLERHQSLHIDPLKDSEVSVRATGYCRT